MRLPAAISPMLLFTAVCAAVCVVGMNAHLERYVTPESGLGYLLGIAGGSSMLLLLLYPLRKRATWLAPMGSVALWFQIHMILGIVGPVLVLFHANFQPGATNSNVALVCMLVVAGSGLIGRYFYSRVHTSLHGTQNTLSDLRGQIERMQSVSSSMAILPEFSTWLTAAEADMARDLGRIPAAIRPLLTPLAAWRARHVMRRHVRVAALAHSIRTSRPLPSLQREIAAANQLAWRHIDLVRRTAELDTYERLLALWHLLHLPLFFMLLVAGIVHVVAVHLY